MVIEMLLNYMYSSGVVLSLIYLRRGGRFTQAKVLL